MKNSLKMLITDIFCIIVWILVVVYNCIVGPTLIAYIGLGISFLVFMLLYFISTYIKFRRKEKELFKMEEDCQ